jgi:hypothetical protein
MTPLQQRMSEDMTVRGLVPSTQRAYLRAVRDLAAYSQRSPDTLSTRDIQRRFSRPEIDSHFSPALNLGYGYTKAMERLCNQGMGGHALSRAASRRIGL